MLGTVSSQIFKISPDYLDYLFHSLTVLKRKSILTTRWNLFWTSLWWSLTLPPHTAPRSPFCLLDDPLTDTVKLLSCPLKASSCPNWASPISSAALTGHCCSPPVITGLLIQPSISGCTDESCLHCVHLWGRAHPHSAHSQTLSWGVSSFPGAELCLNPCWISWVPSSSLSRSLRKAALPPNA